MNRFPTVGTVLAVLALFLAACGDSADTAATDTSAAVTTTADAGTTPEATEAPRGDDGTDQPDEAGHEEDHEADPDEDGATTTTIEDDDHDHDHDHDHPVAASGGDADPADATDTIVVELADGAVVGGAQNHDVDTGAVVLIEVVLDRADEVHLHGYDFTVEGEAGDTVQIAFVASIPGVWEVELEGAGLELAEITVS